jgi:hypothetical protein
MLRIDEVTSLECGSIDIIPGQRAYYEVRLKHVRLLRPVSSTLGLCTPMTMIRRSALCEH